MNHKTTRFAGWAASLLGALSISGCTGCGSAAMGSGNSACWAPVIAGAVLVAPVAVPAQLLFNAADKHRENAKRDENWRKMLAEDPATVAICVIGCDWPEVSTDADRQRQREVYRHGVDLVIAWWGENPQPSQIPALMVAYYRKGARLMKSDPAQADFFLRQAAVWSTDPRIVQGLKEREFGGTRYNDYFYNEIVSWTQENLMILRYRGIDGRQPDPDILKDRCQAIAAWPPAWNQEYSSTNPDSACRSAYKELFEKKFPTDMPTITDSVIDPVRKQPE